MTIQIEKQPHYRTTAIEPHISKFIEFLLFHKSYSEMKL